METKKTVSLLAILSFGFLIVNSLLSKPTFSYKKSDSSTYACTINFSLEPNDAILYDTIDISIDDSSFLLSDWNAYHPIEQYIPEFKETKKVLTKNFHIQVKLQKKNSSNDEKYLHISYYQKKYQKVVEHVFALPKTPENSIKNIENNSVALTKSNIKHNETPEINSWTNYISNIFKTTNSITLRIILALILGLLLSLTPCIYPMIPITIGILQSQASSSMFYNFLLAVSYATGMATTFSLLGLVAAFTGQLFGNIMNNPLVIIAIVGLLIYLAGSMIGFYDMYMPKILQKSDTLKGGSITSAFLFGVISGTIASPCLSPGLLLLLTIVTTLQSKILGFLLLFSFGVGLSIPLLIIGTFSSSLHVLPSSGSWMIDIKKLVGFMMLGICFYFLNTLLPIKVTLWLFGIFILFMGVFYLHEAGKLLSSLTRKIKSSGGTLLIACSVLIFAKAYQSGINQNELQPNIWLANYTLGLEQAKKEHKKILLDISAPYCSICKAIDKKVFTDHQVQETLSTYVIPIKIDELDTNNEIHCGLQKRYNIMGVPTLLLIDSENEEELQRWGSELYDKDTKEFITELQRY